MALDTLRFGSGRLSLDLLATVGSRLGAHPLERLGSTERLQEWLAGSGLVPAGRSALPDEHWLAEFREVRSLLHRTVHAVLHGRVPDPRDVRHVNERAAIAPPAPQAVVEDDGTVRVRLVEPVTLPSLVSAVCRDAIDLLAGEDRVALRECAGDTCDLVYLDHSRGRRRRWCSSRSCGNRERVARYRDRRRDTVNDSRLGG